MADHILEMAGIIMRLMFYKNILLKQFTYVECRKLFLRVKDEFEVINQFILFRLILNITG